MQVAAERAEQDKQRKDEGGGGIVVDALNAHGHAVDALAHGLAHVLSRSEAEPFPCRPAPHAYMCMHM